MTFINRFYAPTNDRFAFTKSLNLMAVQSRWLVLPVVLTVLGSTTKVVAQERTDISTPNLEPMGSNLAPTGEMNLPQSVSVSSPKNLADNQYWVQQGVGGRVWGVGEEEDGDCHPNEPLNCQFNDSQVKNSFTTPHTPHPTPGAPIPPQLNTDDGVSWARPDENWSTQGLAEVELAVLASKREPRRRDTQEPGYKRLSEWGIIPHSSFPMPNGKLSQVPRPIIPRSPEQPTPTLPPIREEPLQPAPPTLPISPNRQDIPGTITVERFEFVGNTAFSNEELAEITKPFTKKPITFTELLQVEALVSKKYTDAGYINSGAVIPADQTLLPSGAIITIRLIEGGVEDIKVTGTRRLTPSYVRSRLRRATSIPLNRERLLEALQLLQLDPLIKNISAELSAGSRPELSLLEVRVQEADSFDTTLFADNGRTPSVGSFRRGVRINEGNLLGFGDLASISYTNTNGSNAFDFSYTAPINPRNGTIKLAAGLDDTKVTEPPFDRIDITGNSRYYELTFRQPIIATPSQEFALGLTVSRQESATKLLGLAFPLSAGADNDGKTKISALRFFQEWTRRSPQQIFAVRSQFSLGLGVLDATINKDPPDSRFFSWRGQTQYVRLLAPDSLLILRSDAQLTTRPLVPLEQFGLGGLRSVRGYRQDVLLTDNAIFASVEVRLPIYRAQKLGGILHLAPFVDFGIGWNSSRGTIPSNSTLVSVGLGLQWQMGNQLTARFDYGIPLIEVNSGEKRTLQEQGVYFSLNYSPF